MPVVKNLSKLQKKKGDSKLHPNGRKFKQISSANHRNIKLNAVKAQRADMNEKKMQRHKFFQDICNNLDKPQYSISDIKTICQEYIDRNVPELTKLSAERRPGRAPTNHHQQLKIVYDAECEEYRTGFNVIDLTDTQTVKNLKDWNGTWGGLNTLKMIRVARDD